MQDDWLRYSCQLALPGFGKESQLKLQNAKVLIVGAGGLGCPAAQYLVAAGVGTVAIADYDIISITNLHRQILYASEEIGLLKADVACKKLRVQNPGTDILPITEKISVENVFAIIEAYDIVIDCTDNFEAKNLLNDACVITGKPLVYGAIYQYEGQLSVLNILNDDGTRSPNYRDLFPDVHAAEIPNCAEGGVMPTIAGIIGCMQANEVIKFIIGSGDLLAGKLLVIDASSLESRIIKTGRVTKTIINKLPETIFVYLISVGELKNSLAKNKYELIDVRTIEERHNYNIGGKHIPLSEIDTNFFPDDPDKPIIFYCETGRRSAEAAKIVSKKFPGARFFSLDGGLNAWKKTETINQENI
ncbi:MAG TPA: HesA/MoeB/ThiF family protein [Puia sp.]|jgi:adenylyltransferase/sulfurtransferase|nr:HesA/MoeB/ThiF family protein [Puia sp.]